MFKLISICISARDAMDILKEHCEWSGSVRKAKFQMFGIVFENMKMKEVETNLS